MTWPGLKIRLIFYGSVMSCSSVFGDEAKSHLNLDEFTRRYWLCEAGVAGYMGLHDFMVSWSVWVSQVAWAIGAFPQLLAESSLESISSSSSSSSLIFTQLRVASQRVSFAFSPFFFFLIVLLSLTLKQRMAWCCPITFYFSLFLFFFFPFLFVSFLVCFWHCISKMEREVDD